MGTAMDMVRLRKTDTTSRILILDPMLFRLLWLEVLRNRLFLLEDSTRDSKRTGSSRSRSCKLRVKSRFNLNKV